ncbi:MAG: hypothetical protein ABIS50_24545 [Luteolibacter sp.]|uniref:hypothetical protein n=1 Tax=Luteolibacter sp. TaxID=1962973 RepID=UPI003262FAD8
MSENTQSFGKSSRVSSNDFPVPPEISLHVNLTASTLARGVALPFTHGGNAHLGNQSDANNLGVTTNTKLGISDNDGLPAAWEMRELLTMAT